MRQYRNNQGRNPEQENASFKMIKFIVIISITILTLRYIII